MTMDSHVHVHDEKAQEYFRDQQPPGIEPGASDLNCQCSTTWLWPPGDSQPSQFSLSLCMCRQNPIRDQPV